MLRERSLDDPMLDIGRNLIWERGFPNDMGKQKTGTPYLGIIHLQSFSLEFGGQILRALATSTF